MYIYEMFTVVIAKIIVIIIRLIIIIKTIFLITDSHRQFGLVELCLAIVVEHINVTFYMPR